MPRPDDCMDKVPPPATAERRLEAFKRRLMAGADNCGRNGHEDHLWPVAVEIQPTARCHRTCSFCSHIVRNKVGSQLDVELVLALLDELESLGVRRIALSGGGEPLYWGVPELTRVARRASSFASVSLTSSGDQFWDREGRRLVPDIASILEPYRDVYLNTPDVEASFWAKQVVGGNSWADVSALLQELRLFRANKASLSLRLHAVVVVTLANAARLPLIDSVLVDHGVDSIYFKEFKNFEQRKVGRLKAEASVLRRLITQVPFSRPPSESLVSFLRDLSQSDVDHHPCWTNRLGHNAVIDPSGDVFLCTPTVGSAEHAIGNVHKSSFSAIWTAARRASILGQLDERASSGGCPAECREHAMNRRLAKAMQGL